ncbi:MAG: 50S ribosomal protein L6 [Candidatus Thorarchaeota archaeon]|jgi:large subunit ribosomal protein L6
MARKKIHEIIEIPEGVQVEIVGNKVKMKKGSEEVGKRVSYSVKQEDKKLVLSNENPTKRDKRLIKTTLAHLKNMVEGLGEKYIYKLQICSVHFPINVEVKEDNVIVKNFLGEVKERRAKILSGVQVKVEGEFVTVESSDKEKAGQTAANIETTTKIRKKDRRIFQDGIFIVEKQKGRKR